MKIRNPFVIRSISRLIVWTMRMLFWTCRKQIHFSVPNSNGYEIDAPEKFLFCIWHDHILLTLFSGKPKKMAGLVSQHGDGTFLSEAMEIMNMTAIRGSSSRGGAQAMRDLIERVKQYHVAITPDGPRGPRREVKPGIIFLASRSGQPIIPVIHSTQRGWNWQGSWTDMLIPKPFTTVYLLAGEAMHIPPSIGKDEQERWAKEVQSRMEELDGIMERWKAGEDLHEMLKTLSENPTIEPNTPKRKSA